MTYREFVFSKLREVLGETDEQIIEFMVRDWISTHQPYIQAAGASIDAWRESEALRKRGTGRGMYPSNAQ